MFLSIIKNSEGKEVSKGMRSSCIYSIGGSITFNWGSSRSDLPKNWRANFRANCREGTGRVGMLALT